MLTKRKRNRINFIDRKQFSIRLNPFLLSSVIQNRQNLIPNFKNSIILVGNDAATSRSNGKILSITSKKISKRGEGSAGRTPKIMSNNDMTIIGDQKMEVKQADTSNLTSFSPSGNSQINRQRVSSIDTSTVRDSPIKENNRSSVKPQISNNQGTNLAPQNKDKQIISNQRNPSTNFNPSFPVTPLKINNTPPKNINNLMNQTKHIFDNNLFEPPSKQNLSTEISKQIIKNSGLDQQTLDNIESKNNSQASASTLPNFDTVGKLNPVSIQKAGTRISEDTIKQSGSKDVNKFAQLKIENELRDFDDSGNGSGGDSDGGEVKARESSQRKELENLKKISRNLDDLRNLLKKGSQKDVDEDLNLSRATLKYLFILRIHRYIYIIIRTFREGFKLLGVNLICLLWVYSFRILSYKLESKLKIILVKL